MKTYETRNPMIILWGIASGRGSVYIQLRRGGRNPHPATSGLPKTHPRTQEFLPGGKPVRKLIVIVFHGVVFGFHNPGANAGATAPNPKDYTAHVVGYAHMDMAWLWRWEESIHDIMYNTFTNQIRLMDQNPDYTFAQDQAVVLDSMEHFYPDIFKGLQAEGPDRQFHSRHLGLGADG